MSACTDYIQTIDSEECVTQSLETINNNFNAIANVVGGLKQRFDKNIQIRTFFYYGPNSDLAPNSDIGSKLVGTAVIDVLKGKASYFDSKKYYAPGFYRMQFKSGAYTIWKTPSNRWYGAGLVTVFPAKEVIGVNTLYPTPEAAQSAGQNYYSSGQPYYKDFYHPGGTIYGIFYDKPYKDNSVSAYGAPVWNLYTSAANINAAPGSSTQSGITSTRPSDLTIQAFVNSNEQLNLTAISKPGDIAYIVYQKTGYYNSLGQGYDPAYQFGQTTQDIVTYFSPSFFIWRLTYQSADIGYTVDSGFPKFNRAQTSATGATSTNWNKPQNWSTY